MKRKNVIILLTPNQPPECFGNFKKLCETKGLPYHSLKMKPFPLEHGGSVIHRVEFK